MTITVCIPYFNAPDLLNRAAASVLAQTVTDLQLVVVGDGEDPIANGALHPSSYLDPRCVVHVLPENRGPYFAQQVVLSATPHAWYAVVGADDWIEPDHLERFAALGATAAVPGNVWLHAYDEPVRIHRGNFEVGLFAVDRLRALGGHNPAERLGQDTLMKRLLALTGPVVELLAPTYHRVKRAGTLTTSPATRRGSPARNEMRVRNRAVYAAAVRLGSIDRIRDYRLDLIPPAIAAEVEEQAAHLRARFGQAVAA